MALPRSADDRRAEERDGGSSTGCPYLTEQQVEDIIHQASRASAKVAADVAADVIARRCKAKTAEETKKTAEEAVELIAHKVHREVSVMTLRVLATIGAVSLVVLVGWLHDRGYLSV